MDTGGTSRLGVGLDAGTAAGIVPAHAEQDGLWIIRIHDIWSGDAPSIGMMKVETGNSCPDLANGKSDVVVPPSCCETPSRLGCCDRSSFLMKTYMCVICGFVYEEEKGLPEEGIAPGTKWEDVPMNWRCPECQAGKEDFEMVEI